ncbi:c-type cytochrome [Vulgatibacter sp.]|uniref:c-type cytochrome n=1 Tax=Vulgatibacter sp. TaxID=1971226 RepID=UPI00356471DF
MAIRILSLIVAVLVAACGSVVEPAGPGGSGDGLGNGGAGGSGGPGTGGTGGGMGEAPAEVQQGAALFATHCQMCHGPEASGGAAYPASLAGRTGIASQVRNGSAGMPAFDASRLGDDDIAAIEAWLVWLAEPGNGAGGAGGGAGTGDPFLDHCAGCHGATGEGTSLAPQIRSPHEGYAAWVVRNGRDSMGYQQPMPAFSEQAVSSADLDEIFTFLQGQPMPADGQGLYLRFCGNCHGSDGRGGVAGESARDDAGERDDFLRTVREGDDGAGYGDRRGYMPGRGRGELTDEEVERIRQYLLGATSSADGRYDDEDDEDDEEDGGDDDSVGCASAGGDLGLAALGLSAALASLRRSV